MRTVTNLDSKRLDSFSSNTTHGCISPFSVNTRRQIVQLLLFAIHITYTTQMHFLDTNTNKLMEIFIASGCLLSIAVAVATVSLNTCSGQRTDLGMIPGLCANVRSGEFRRVCCRINILGSQLSPSSINLVPGVSWEGNRKSSVALAMHQTPWFIHLRAQRPKTGR